MKVSATWTVHQKEGSVTVSASFQVIDVKSAAVVKAAMREQKETDTVKWARYTGDSRALTWEASRLCEVEDTNIDPPEVLVHKALTSLGRTLASELVTFFR